MEKKVKIGDKEYTLNELSYMQSLEIEELKVKGIRGAVQKMLIFSTGLSEEEVNKISLREGLELQKEINSLNGFEGFQNPVEQKTSEGL